MKISTKGRYGLSIMLELALAHEKELLSVRTIAAKQEISEKYIEQIISMLNKGGLVISQRGAQGGYRLAAAPEEITVGQILRITEGGLEPVKCVAEHPEACSRIDRCISVDIWRDVREAIENVVDGITLSDLVQRYFEKCNIGYTI